MRSRSHDLASPEHFEICTFTLGDLTWESPVDPGRLDSVVDKAHENAGRCWIAHVMNKACHDFFAWQPCQKHTSSLSCQSYLSVVGARCASSQLVNVCPGASHSDLNVSSFIAVP